MNAMAQKIEIPGGYMEDAKGRLVPVESVKEIDKMRDDLVKEIIQKSEEVRLSMAEFKNRVYGDIDAFVDCSAERFQTKIGGAKGNLQLVSYDGRKKVVVAVSERISFDERLQVAKALIDECIHEWSEGSSPEIRTLVNDAFQVDKAGNVAAWRVLSLRRHNIDHPKWRRAMDAISESVQVDGTKSYIRVYRREKADGQWEMLPLDMAAI